MSFFSFFFNDTATTEIYTLSLHDALPIYYFPYAYPSPDASDAFRVSTALAACPWNPKHQLLRVDRKSTRLNSSHSQISYAVFCLKKKKKTATNHRSFDVTT